MILIYAFKSSTRLQYICRFIFKEQLGLGYTLTNELQSFKDHDGPKINYSREDFDPAAFHIPNHDLIFENGIHNHQVSCFEVNGFKAFFATPGAAFPFDIIAASFYLLSRYEEYLEYDKDEYGRFSHKNSLAFKEGFLQVPLVHYWIKNFGETLKKKMPGLAFSYPSFSMKLTYDIDIAWSYKHKGLLRNLGGFLKKPSFARLKVLAGLGKDPFDTYQWLDDLHDRYRLEPIYFFLVASRRSSYDKNISPYSHSMWQLLKKHASKYRVGLHPSWRSNDSIDILKKEKKILETATNSPVHFSRQHYIRFTLPETFERLLEAGITDDFSMGYGSINGFRASVASPFYWYNLQEEKITTLRIHPFCYMDANSFFEQHQSAEESSRELLYYYATCRDAGIPFISIFHNNFLGTDPQFQGWKEMYAEFISQLPQ